MNFRKYSRGELIDAGDSIGGPENIGLGWTKLSVPHLKFVGAASFEIAAGKQLLGDSSCSVSDSEELHEASSYKQPSSYKSQFTCICQCEEVPAVDS